MSTTYAQQSAQRKQLLDEATSKQRQACGIAYRKHQRACEAVGLTPSDFETFFIEWLECQRGEDQQPTETANSERSNDDVLIRRYEALYEGLRGYEAA